ncbi:MAG TPA: 4Fe-4S dicluster domain-containing protein [Kofleriaceae bacterium]|nr:4Fe-4S dicluster domain-containing protein [Kofleriaceae bacterium]
MTTDRRTFLRGAAVASAACALPTPAAAAEPARRHRHWGMVIDLDRCSGCNACSVACRQENNLPSFGPDPKFDGARPEWMSLLWQDPTRDDGVPQLLPLPCMHCADPPCVKVCPVGATYKDPDGFTMQIWDRCIGCRYCMVACPYSRRSFNWSEPAWTPSEVQMLNPDVATRPLGVVEKCTFCHHRVRQLTEQARLEGREPTDAECQHLPACAAACPGRAITFGDLDDPESAVAELARSPRAFRLLEHLGTEPSVYYLEKDRG